MMNHIDNYDKLLELHLSSSPSTFDETISFFKETGLIINEDDEFNFVVAFYGDVKTKWVLQEDGRYKFERTET